MVGRIRTGRTLALLAGYALVAMVAGCGDERRSSRTDDDRVFAPAMPPSGERFRPPMRADAGAGSVTSKAAPALIEASPQALGAALTAGLPNGRYRCDIWMGNSGLNTLGFVDILDGGYRGPSDNPIGGYSPLSIDGSGRMAWSPMFSQLAATGAVITRSTVSGTAAAPGFTVEYTTGGGNLESMDCTRV